MALGESTLQRVTDFVLGFAVHRCFRRDFTSSNEGTIVFGMLGIRSCGSEDCYR